MPHAQVSLKPRAVRRPVRASLRAHWIKIFDQLSLGSCTANAVIALLIYNYWKTGRVPPELSRLFQYFAARARVAGGSPTEDSGCSVTDAIQTPVLYGACPESLWPYDVNLFDLNPPPECWEAALAHHAYSPRSLPDLESIKEMIAWDAEQDGGYPVALGFTVYPSMMTPEVATTGVIPMPGDDEQLDAIHSTRPDEQRIGGHCVVAAAYDDEKEELYGPNSWGQWGNGGWWTMGYKVAARLGVSDAHVLLREDY